MLDGVDIENPTTYEGYFVNVSKLFFVTAATSNMVNQSKTLVDVAVKAGVTHIVKLSVLGAGELVVHFPHRKMLQIQQIKLHSGTRKLKNI